MKGINIFLANGFEDVEALGTNDVLIRGGLKTNLISVSTLKSVTSSHKLKVNADQVIDELDNINHEGTCEDDFLIFPGGMPGTLVLEQSPSVIELMQKHYAAGGSIAAICAAPGLVLRQLDKSILKGLEFTCYAGFEQYMTVKGAIFNPKPVVRSGRIITGRSAGHSLSFGLEILKAIKGEELAAKVAHDLYLD